MAQSGAALAIIDECRRKNLEMSGKADEGLIRTFDKGLEAMSAALNKDANIQQVLSSLEESIGSNDNVNNDNVHKLTLGFIQCFRSTMEELTKGGQESHSESRLTAFDHFYESIRESIDEMHPNATEAEKKKIAREENWPNASAEERRFYETDRDCGGFNQLWHSVRARLLNKKPIIDETRKRKKLMRKWIEDSDEERKSVMASFTGNGDENEELEEERTEAIAPPLSIDMIVERITCYELPDIVERVLAKYDDDDVPAPIDVSHIPEKKDTLEDSMHRLSAVIDNAHEFFENIKEHVEYLVNCEKQGVEKPSHERFIESINKTYKNVQSTLTATMGKIMKENQPVLPEVETMKEEFNVPPENEQLPAQPMELTEGVEEGVKEVVDGLVERVEQRDAMDMERGEEDMEGMEEEGEEKEEEEEGIEVKEGEEKEEEEDKEQKEEEEEEGVEVRGEEKDEVNAGVVDDSEMKNGEGEAGEETEKMEDPNSKPDEVIDEEENSPNEFNPAINEIDEESVHLGNEVSQIEDEKEEEMKDEEEKEEEEEEKEEEEEGVEADSFEGDDKLPKKQPVRMDDVEEHVQPGNEVSIPAEGTSNTTQPEESGDESTESTDCFAPAIDISMSYAALQQMYQPTAQMTTYTQSLTLPITSISQPSHSQSLDYQPMAANQQLFPPFVREPFGAARRVIPDETENLPPHLLEFVLSGGGGEEIVGGGVGDLLEGFEQEHVMYARRGEMGGWNGMEGRGGGGGEMEGNEEWMMNMGGGEIGVGDRLMEGYEQGDAMRMEGREEEVIPVETAKEEEEEQRAADAAEQQPSNISADESVNNVARYESIETAMAQSPSPLDAPARPETPFVGSYPALCYSTFQYLRDAYGQTSLTKAEIFNCIATSHDFYTQRTSWMNMVYRVLNEYPFINVERGESEEDTLYSLNWTDYEYGTSRSGELFTREVGQIEYDQVVLEVEEGAEEEMNELPAGIEYAERAMDGFIGALADAPSTSAVTPRKRGRPLVYAPGCAPSFMKEFPCAHCPYVATTSDHLEAHTQGHERMDGYKCRHCTYRAPTETGVKVHSKVHNATVAKEATEASGYEDSYSPMGVAGGSKSTKKKVKREVEEEEGEGEMDSLVTPQSRKRSSLGTPGNQQSAGSEKKQFPCSLCPYVCDRASRLKAHMARHRKKADHQCPHCTFSTDTEFMLRAHIELHEKTEALPVGGGRSGKKVKREVEGEDEGGEKESLVDPAPSAVSTNLVTTPTKQQSAGSENQFPCSLCPFIGNRAGNLKSHIENGHDRKDDYQCPHCTFSAVNEFILIRHIKLHEDAAALPGGKAIKKQPEDNWEEGEEMDSHADTSMSLPVDGGRSGKKEKREVEEEESLVDAPSSVSRKRSLAMLSPGYGHEQKKFLCELCPYVGTRSNHIKDHMANGHNKKNEFQCPDCSYSASQKYILAAHVELHNPTKSANEGEAKRQKRE